MRPPRRRLLGRLGLVALGGAVLGALGLVGPLRAPVTGWLYRRGHIAAAPEGDGLIFVVLDTVRADHTSLCGYSRPTTPTLEALAAAGARYTCRAYAPGSWTLPSHASYFTGEAVLEHGAHELPAVNIDLSGAGVPADHLSPRKVTVAETLAGRGYQTLALSENPVVGDALGLRQGFRTMRSARRFGELTGAHTVETLRGLLQDELDPTGGPLFLFLNLASAHQPWEAVPAEVPWLPTRARLGWDSRPGGRWARFLTGKMGADEAAHLLGWVTDGYDWGVTRADDTLGRALTVVQGSGFCPKGCRVIVTSDHGELLGEHDLIDHGFYLYEENNRVFLLDSAGGEPFPEPINAMVVASLLRDGALPDPLPAVEAVAWPHARRAHHSEGAAFNSRSAALWDGPEKWMWMDGQARRTDLRLDPGEAAGAPLGAAEIPAGLSVLVEGVLGVRARGEAAGDAAAEEALRAAGYLE